MYNIINTNGKNEDFKKLCILLDDNLNEIVGGEKQRSQYNQYNVLNDIHDVILIYDGKLPIACGSFKKYDDECAELKRMFVRKEYRGKGLSKQILSDLEKTASDQGFLYMILESGEILKEAMTLYRKSGYEVIANYGVYKNMPESVCMKKKLRG
ncbi:MAG: GNAT family N-acetyltransferase [Spirochaetes bacterium GWF1_31_7]|nr:MAG: GNAT family N-acetyltransferase [Spirochaetes bacterium GWE1_32_154]OHD45951.1 MAG: GNAT family N-acetyltransferase [Spirochaetes bacterium GWE2_31_10]OHD48116.1 MAG: GNAT family N-acetyltransferase [Spirochaetes bacterium GWF1_31_7]OHD80411.1 MAG: GNAT family N-acetyltransferase [Spirochaetes bacterium RIFOXYB1_FULL_32_8]HBD95818.1 GNAT family N-acetyltransferase [Spirochaetia bacterium]